MSSLAQLRRPAASLTSRPYQNEQDLRQMQDLLIEGRARSGDWRYRHVGELTFDFWMVACHLDPRAHIHLWHDGTRLAGYALLGEDPALDWQVLPEYESCDIEAGALALAESRLAELIALDAPRWGGPLVCGARQDDAPRIAFLAERGFRYRGAFAEVNMLRPLDEPIPDPAPPAGCRVRAVSGLEEVPARAAAQRAVWQPWTVGEVTDEDYVYLMGLPGYERELDVVTVAADGALAAYVHGWIDPVNRIGDFGPVGALPAYRRQGLTRAALLEGLRRMRARGMERVCISTGIGNIPARRLYASVGFRIANAYLDYVQSC